MTPPLLCLCLTAPTLAENLAQARRLQALVDLVELRVDLLHPSQWSGIARFPLECPLPALCTIRRVRDGGSWPAPEQVRRRLLQAAAGARYRYLDLEADLPAAAVAVPPRGPRVIRSLHDPRGTPANLDLLLRGLARGPREIPKLAVTPRGVGELARLVSAARAAAGPRIVLGMGDYGVPSRLLAARLGSWLTFTSAGPRRAAPGQLDPVTLQRRYRFHSLRGDTPVYGVIGNPVAHSRSPEVHNRGLAAAGAAGVYVPFRVDCAAQFLALAPALGVRGLSVTIPHKEAVIPLLARRDASVRGCGACNTLVWERGGWTGYNTDAAGFLAPLQPELAAGRIRRAAVIGAGGAARAIVWALRGAGVEVLIVNRHLPRAQRLAAELGAAAAALSAADLAQRSAGYRDLIVQATSVGMYAGGAPERAAAGDPIAALPLVGREIVYDIVYTPPETPLLRRARAAGCQVISGAEMLLGQAGEQFRLFTGKEYPAGERARMSAALRGGAGAGRQVPAPARRY